MKLDEPMFFAVDDEWTPILAVGAAGPVPIGEVVEVRRLRGESLGLFKVTHLYRYQCDGQPGDDHIVVTSPGTPHVTIVHQRDYKPITPSEWAVGLSEYEPEGVTDGTE